MNKQTARISLILSCISFSLINTMDNNNSTKLANVCALYANLMIEPKANENHNPQDQNQDTQVLYNESVNIIKDNIPGWYQVEALDQTKMENGKLVPHVGWIESKQVLPQVNQNNIINTIILQQPWTRIRLPEEMGNQCIYLPAGTKINCIFSDDNYYKGFIYHQNAYYVATIDKEDAECLSTLNNLDLQSKRLRIKNNAMKFESHETIYYWGGLTATGIDCSGLTHLCYRMVGMQIPRDSKDQYLAAKPQAPKELQPGDLIFLARAEDPTRIRHVMLYGGNDQIIDAIGTDRFGTKWERVRKTTGQQWLNKPFTQIDQKEEVRGYVIYGGSFLE